MSPRLDLVESLAEKYRDLPREVVFKEDLLRTGVAFSRDALAIASGYKPKAYFIFAAPRLEGAHGGTGRAIAVY